MGALFQFSGVPDDVFQCDFVKTGCMVSLPLGNTVKPVQHTDSIPQSMKQSRLTCKLFFY